MPRLAQQDVCPDSSSCTTNVSGCSGEGQNRTCSDVGPQYSDADSNYTPVSGGATASDGGPQGGSAPTEPQLLVPGISLDGTFVYGGVVGHSYLVPEVPIFALEGEAIAYGGFSREGKLYGGALAAMGYTVPLRSIMTGVEVQVDGKGVGAGAIGMREWSLGPFNGGHIEALTGHGGATYFGLTLGDRITFGVGVDDVPDE